VTVPGAPGRVLLVDATPADVERLATLPGLEQVSSADLAGRISVGGAVDVVVIGSAAPGAVAAVQRAHGLAPDSGVAVLVGDGPAVHRQLTFAPGVPLDLLVVEAADPAAPDRVADLRRTAARRRRHTAVLATVVRHADAVGGSDATQVTDVGALLEHAPMAVLLTGPGGRLRGWNRRAEQLFALRPSLSGRPVEDVVPGALALLAPEPARSATGEQPVLQLLVGGVDVELTAVPSQGPQGDPVVLLIASDVTAHRRAERERDRLAEQVTLLGQVSEVLTESLDASESLSRLAGSLVPTLADWVSIQLREEHHQLVDVAVRHRDPALTGVTAAVEELARRTGSSTEASRLAGAGEVVVQPVLDAAGLLGPVPDPALRSLVAQLGVASALAVPLHGRSGVLGSLLLVRDGRRTGFTEADQGLVVEVGRRAGIALDNARLYAGQRHLATELQQSLLTAPPHLDFADIAVRYVAAAQQAQVGGDWYDAFRQRNGDLTLVIGDVVGHDTKAAAEMGQLRALVRGISFTTAQGPQQTLSAVDLAMEGLELSTIATALVVRLTPPDGDATGVRFRWSSAGHPPPLLLDTAGRATLLEHDGGKADLLLGVDAGARRRTSSGELPSSATLLLYTDGLIEKRGQSLDDGLATLVQVVQEHAGDSLDELCDAVLRSMVPDAGEDDVALVAVRPRDRGPADAASGAGPEDPAAEITALDAVRESWRSTAAAPAAPLVVSLPLTTLRELGRVRRRVRAELAASLHAAGTTDEDTVDDVVDRSILVIDELASNALRHGALPAELQLRDGGDHWVVVAVDSAPHVRPTAAVDRPAGQGGYGLYVVADLTLDHGVEVTEHSKRVWAVLTRSPG